MKKIVQTTVGKYLVFLTFFAISVVAIGASQTSSFYSKNPSQFDAMSAFNYFSNNVARTPVNWSGSISGCVPGSPSADSQQATLDTVNYMRSLSGLDAVTFNASQSNMAQKAALIMAAQNDLSHSPPMSWACYTADGRTGAGSSNLALGVSGPRAILAYMDDDDPSNIDALGHRRWILNSRVEVMANGDTDRSNALWVINDTPPPVGAPTYVGWPAEGHFPAMFVPPIRWSLTNTDDTVVFTDAVVSVTKNGTPLGVTTHRLGSDTVAWDIPTSLSSAPGTYQILVSGLKDTSLNPISDYAYTVTVFDAYPFLFAGFPNQPSGEKTYIRSNGDIYAKDRLGDPWVKVFAGNAVQLYSDDQRFGFKDSSNRLWLKEGVYGSWHEIFSGSDEARVSDRNIVIRANGDVYVKSAMTAPWIKIWSRHIGPATNLFAEGDRFGFVDSGGRLWLKDGIYGSWHHMFTGADEVKISATSVVVRHQGNIYVKNALSSSWVKIWSAQFGPAVRLYSDNDRFGFEDSGGRLWIKDGVFGSWYHVMSGADEVALTSRRVVMRKNGDVFAKQTLTSSWVKVWSTATSPATGLYAKGTRIGLVDSSNRLWIKEGIFEHWVFGWYQTLSEID